VIARRDARWTHPCLGSPGVLQSGEVGHAALRRLGFIGEPDLDPARGSLLVRQGKGGKRREVPWTPAAARNHMRRIAARAGVRRRFAPHQLRHAHAVEMARERVPLNVIQRQLGHVNLGVTSDCGSEARDRARAPAPTGRGIAGRSRLLHGQTFLDHAQIAFPAARP
jgi:hypothetical protein